MKFNATLIALLGAALTLNAQTAAADHKGHTDHKPTSRISEGGPRGEHCKTKGKCCKNKRMKRFFRAIDASPEQRQAIRADVKPLRGEMRALRERMQVAKKAFHNLDRTNANFLANANMQADIIGSIKAEKLKLRAQIEQRVASHLTQDQLVTAKALRQKKRCNKGKRYGKTLCPTKAKYKGKCNKPKCDKPRNADGKVKCPIKQAAHKKRRCGTAQQREAKTIRHFRR